MSRDIIEVYAMRIRELAKLREEVSELRGEVSHYPCGHSVERQVAALVCPVCERLTLESYVDEVEKLRAYNDELQTAVKRIAELEHALIEYGFHDIGCRWLSRLVPHGDVSPDAVCTCGLERAINGE